MGKRGRTLERAAESRDRRLRLAVRGAVQGVGFRPFLYRMARELDLAGWVVNDVRGVLLEVEGPEARLRELLERLPAERPPRAVLHAVEPAWLEPAGYSGFEIRHSDASGAKTAVVLPDVATCPACLAEVLDPADRRCGYPFTNCTDCGPRFTIVLELPYDRPGTTMRGFTMCPDCLAEYRDPENRRFHAQPNACPRCGPGLALWNREGDEQARGAEALEGAAAALERGEVLAAKGLGGFHLMVDARNPEAVERLRRRKARPAKPLALMVRDLAAARELCRVTESTARVLGSPEAPIVLLPRLPEAAVAPGVAPGNPHLGVMLPYTPLHHLLLGRTGFSLVATSGNLSDEPIAIDEGEALDRLGGIADLFLVHDRPIARHADDSVVRPAAGGPQVLRRARGYAPLPVLLERELPAVLAVGAHLKNVVALSSGERVFLSQHIGDMETPQALAAFEAVIRDFLRLYEARPVALACDLHPDYPSSRWAREAAVGPWEPAAAVDAGKGWREALAGLPVLEVQHHHAHLAACLAEHGVAGPALGVTWDGTGYGPDGTVWGGELLVGDRAGYRRLARLRPFRLPGGEAAVREPRRTALAVLWELLGEEALERDDLAPVRAFAPGERQLLGRMLERGLNAPVTSSAGRLFDAVASLLDLGQRVSYEGQAAMALELVADPGERGAYPLPLVAVEPLPTEPAPWSPAFELDWRPLVEAVLVDLGRGAPPPAVAARFHRTLAEGVVAVARAAEEATVVLSGGCFQNRLLEEETARRLGEEGFRVLVHRRIPPNDGGICLGQVAVAAARLDG